MPEIALETRIITKRGIRKHFDETNRKWYFSIVDVLESLTNTTDARNYWKVLKNRLKKRDPGLVTKCNRLKLMAKDGKYYLTDVADSETIIHIIESVPKASVEAFKELIGTIEKGVGASSLLDKVEPEEIVESTEAKLLVDAYETGAKIIIKAMIAGVEPKNLFINLKSNKITISGRREKDLIPKDYLREELDWVTFSRTIPLPSPVQTEKYNLNEDMGLLIIELLKI